MAANEIEWKDDGLVTPEVGTWSRAKYHYLLRYLDAFTCAMAGKPQWRNGLYFVDLFAGAGAVRIRGTQTVLRGSALIAAMHAPPLAKVLCVEQDGDRASALEKRLAQLLPKAAYGVTRGDANDVVVDVLAGVPAENSLSAVFVDPYGLGIRLTTLQAVALRRADLIILLADHMDAIRNWRTYYMGNPESVLDGLLGASGWRAALSHAAAESQSSVLRGLYEAALRSIGYSYIDFKPIANSRNRVIYCLVFASASPTGLRLWTKVGLKGPDLQRGLDFGPE
jgi:three-Cys-motif partner protein